MHKRSKGASGIPIKIVVVLISAIIVLWVILQVLDSNSNVFNDSLGNVKRYIDSLTS